MNANDPVLWKDLASCNTCGALMRIQERSTHQWWHDKLDLLDQSHSSRMDSISRVIDAIVSKIGFKR